MVITFFARHLLREFGSPKSAHLLSVEGAEIYRFANIAVGFGPRLSDFKNFYCRKFVAPALQDFGCTFQQSSPLFDRRPPPFLECRAGSLNGTFSFVNASLSSV